MSTVRRQTIPRKNAGSFLLLRINVADVRENEKPSSKNGQNCDRSRANQVETSQVPEKTLDRSSTTFSTKMKEASVYHVRSAIPIHTSKEINTGILDSGLGVTLIKKELLAEIPELETPRPAKKFSQSS